MVRPYTLPALATSVRRRRVAPDPFHARKCSGMHRLPNYTRVGPRLRSSLIAFFASCGIARLHWCPSKVRDPVQIRRHGKNDAKLPTAMTTYHRPKTRLTPSDLPSDSHSVRSSLKVTAMGRIQSDGPAHDLTSSSKLDRTVDRVSEFHVRVRAKV